MNRKTRLYAAVSLAALFVAGCSGPCARIESVTAPAPRGGSLDLTTYVAMGTSISAGGQSGGMVETHQARSFPALFAKQIGMASFTCPRVTPDGIPPLLRLVSLSPLVVSNEGRTMGSVRTEDLAQPTAFHNMGIYGAILFDAADSTRYYSPGNAYASFFAFTVRHRGTILSEVASLSPTLISFEYGSNEVLGPAINGSGTPAMDAATFGYLLDGTLTGLTAAAPHAYLVLFNVPDVTTIPFVRTVKPYIDVNGTHYPLIGSDGNLSEDDYVLLTAMEYLNAGTGIPVPLGGNGEPLPDDVVLTAEEAATLHATLDLYNAAIAQAAATRGAALVDLNGILYQMSTTGYSLGGVKYTSAFITGGLFSLDGVHPNDLGQGIIANAMISAVNARFGASISYLNLSEIATYSASRAQLVRQEGATGWPRVEGLREFARSLAPRR